LNNILKAIAHGASLAIAFIPALLSGFGRMETMFAFFAQAFAAAPGIPGDYLRIAYYKLTLDQCSLDSRIQFGSFFAHARARVGRGVYIGSFCIFGQTAIGDRTQIASGVQILSGRRQHARDEMGRILGSDRGHFHPVTIGPDCWLGAGAIVMADVGESSTIGAGSVVVQPIPARSVAAGNPARVVKPAELESRDE
jgi:acetyltransferase-like isoleucine patch superfamily enzyme